MKEEKSIELLLENAQLGDKVAYKKQRGYVIGQSSNGDLIIQIQGSTAIAKQKEVTVLRGHANVTDPQKQFKFDEKTQKVLFEQYVKCGIYVGTVPVKLNNCFVKYSEFAKSGMKESLNVFADGEITPMARENVKLQENPSDFANPSDYVDGVIIDEADGQSRSAVLINALDYTNAIGDADMVRIITLDQNGEPGTLDTLPKASLRTISV